VEITTTGGERREIDAAEDLTGTNLPNLFKIKSPQPPPSPAREKVVWK
jgi:hypothetical protein